MSSLPLSTPGKCCAHNLNWHTGVGLENVCRLCSCTGFEPISTEGEADVNSAERKRQCRAHLRGDGDKLIPCEIFVLDGYPHAQDHKNGDLRWTEAVATYPELPLANPDRTTVSHTQVGGNHYSKFKTQPWAIIDEYKLGFYAGNALKYLLRAGHKGPAVEDLRKCKHYLTKMIEIEEAKDAGHG